MALSMVLSILLTVGSGLGIGGNFRHRMELGGSGTQTVKGINPVQHSE